MWTEIRQATLLPKLTKLTQKVAVPIAWAPSAKTSKTSMLCEHQVQQIFSQGHPDKGGASFRKMVMPNRPLEAV